MIIERQTKPCTVKEQRSSFAQVMTDVMCWRSRQCISG